MPYLMFGSAGDRHRAKLLAGEYGGVYWAPEFCDLVVVDPHGLIRLMGGGNARETAEGITVQPRDGAPILLRPLCSLPE